jgi:hypothetical protein
MSSDVPPQPPGDASGASTEGDKPALELGPNLEPAAFSPGRYALVVQRDMQGVHAQQLVREDSTSSFVLELTADGNATACRGWRYSMFNDGPDVRSEERFREQQGYRGRHTVQAGIAEVELELDDSVCQPERQFTLVPRRSSPVTLRCALAIPRDHSSLAAPVLLCRWIGLETREADPLLLPGLAPEGWMVLGSGNGLRVKVSGGLPEMAGGEPPSIQVESPPVPLDHHAWEKPF